MVEPTAKIFCKNFAVVSRSWTCEPSEPVVIERSLRSDAVPKGGRIRLVYLSVGQSMFPRPIRCASTVFVSPKTRPEKRLGLGTTASVLNGAIRL